jgi:hypothetical protein
MSSAAERFARPLPTRFRLVGVRAALVVVAGMLLAVALQAAPSRFCQGNNVQVVGGAVQLEQQWRSVFVEGFEDGFGRWQFNNFEGRLSLDVAEGGEPGKCLRLTNRGKGGDTAFELSSSPIPVSGARRCRLAFLWRAKRSMVQLIGHKGLYETQLQWLDGQGKVLGASPFTLGEQSTAWQRGGLLVAIPEGAASAVIRLGCDAPNLESEEWLEFDSLTLEIQDGTCPFVEAGEFTSRPLLVAEETREVSWAAETPPATELDVVVASAPDAAGMPGAWSEFLGPDGTRTTTFSAPGALPAVHAGRPWLRCRVSLRTRDPRQTPSVGSLTLGVLTDGPWEGPDQTPPTLTERSATRTGDAAAPIHFTLTDETGVDLSTVRVTLDGTDITAALTRADERYTYTPPQALQPCLPDWSLAAWRFSNHLNALMLSSAEARLAGAAPGVRLQRDAGEIDTAFGLESPDLPIQAGATYRLTYWSRHALDLRGAMDGKGTFAGGLIWLDDKLLPLGERVPLDLGPASPDWQAGGAEAVAPAGAIWVRVAFGLDQPNLHSGAFVDLAEVVLDGPRAALPADRPNLHRITVRAADLAGNRLERTWYLLVRPPRTSGLVTVRADGAVLIDGAPFFPIGLYAVWKKPFNDNSFDKAFADLHAAGFNLAHTYSSSRGTDFAEFYAAAARHGIRLYVASGAGANCVRIETVLADVIREEAQPALLAWYLADDTATYVTSHDLGRLSAAIHDVDPAHITVQADATGAPASSHYRDYVGSTDGFMPELYPVRQESAGVPQIIADMKTTLGDLDAAGTRRKTIWAIIQYFQGWGWERYPTRAELWAMSYLSIIHGANGITWYTYGGAGKNHGVTDSPETWATICALAGELAQLQEVLLEPTPPQPPPAVVAAGPALDALGQDSISQLLKTHADKHYLLVANSAAETVTCHLPVGAVGRVQTPFEGRDIAADADGITDTFAPYAVHVYVWGP